MYAFGACLRLGITKNKPFWRSRLLYFLKKRWSLKMSKKKPVVPCRAVNSALLIHTSRKHLHSLHWGVLPAVDAP